MTRIIIIISFNIFLLNTIAFSQPGNKKFKEMREQIKAKKVAFLTEQLDLSVKEAQAFWPIYNEMQEKIEKIHDEERELSHKIMREIETMTDEEIEKTCSRLLEINAEDANIKIEYFKKFKTVLSIKKVAKLHHAERMFRKNIIEQIGKRHRHGKEWQKQE